MKRIIFVLLSYLIVYGCNTIETPPTDNNLDPQSPNYINPVPYDLSVETKGINTIILRWKYFSNNNEGFRVSIESEDNTFKNEIMINQNRRYLEMANLDTSKQYILKIQAFSGNRFTDYSRSIKIGYQDSQSYSISQSIILPTQTVNNFTWGINDHLAIKDNGIVLYSIEANQSVYKKYLTILSNSSKYLFADNDSYFIIINPSASLDVWNMQTKSIEKNYSTQFIDLYASNWNSNTIAISHQNDLNIIEVPSCQLNKSLTFQNTITSISFSDDGNYLLISDSSEIKVYNTSDWSEFRSFSIDTKGEKIVSVDMSLLNEYLVCTYGKYLEVLDLQSNSTIKTFFTPDNFPIKKALFAGNSDVIIFMTIDKIKQMYISHDIVNEVFESTLQINNLEVVNRLKNQFAYADNFINKFGLTFNDFGIWVEIIE